LLPDPVDLPEGTVATVTLHRSRNPAAQTCLVYADNFRHFRALNSYELPDWVHSACRGGNKQRFLAKVKNGEWEFISTEDDGE